MKLLEKIRDNLKEELEGAMDYAEKYIENKAIGNTQRASVYKDMASDELRHAQNIYDFAAKDIAALDNVYHMSVEEAEHWSHTSHWYAEHVAKIKTILA